MNCTKGQILVSALIMGTVSVIVLGALVSWGALNLRIARLAIERERAIQIAEAGNEYYRWRLAQNPTDFQDGTGEEGPYVHDMKDKDGNNIGSFSLSIDPPQLGMTDVTIRSTGSLAGHAAIRAVKTVLAMPTLARYAVVVNSDVRFGEGTEVFGPVHSNRGIRFDGFAHNMVTSSIEQYHDPDHAGPREWAVHTHVNPVDPLPPNPLPSRPDVFSVGRGVSVPAVDFDGLTADLAQIKVEASNGGHYYESTGTTGQGYHIVLAPNGTYDIFRVTRLVTLHRQCPTGQSVSARWGTWSIEEEEVVEENVPLPENGVIFVEDHVWVDGTIDGARLTIAAAEFHESPQRHRSIMVNDNLLYTRYDGSDAIGLIAQQDINVGLESANMLRIDAALIAQNGRVGRHFYYGQITGYPVCGEYVMRDTITSYGMIASNGRYGFSWSCGGTYCSGYKNRNLIYDANFLHAPPPFFPQIMDQYETMLWEEVAPER